MSKDDHTLGTCHCCLKPGMVRYKNIYHIGSEGLWVCMECELQIVTFVRNLRSKAAHAKLQRFKELKKIKVNTV